MGKYLVVCALKLSSKAKQNINIEKTEKKITKRKHTSIMQAKVNHNNHDKN